MQGGLRGPGMSVIYVWARTDAHKMAHMTHDTLSGGCVQAHAFTVYMGVWERKRLEHLLPHRHTNASVRRGDDDSSQPPCRRCERGP